MFYADFERLDPFCRQSQASPTLAIYVIIIKQKFAPPGCVTYWDWTINWTSWAYLSNVHCKTLPLESLSSCICRYLLLYALAPIKMDFVHITTAPRCVRLRPCPVIAHAHVKTLQNELFTFPRDCTGILKLTAMDCKQGKSCGYRSILGGDGLQANGWGRHLCNATGHYHQLMARL